MERMMERWRVFGKGMKVNKKVEIET